MAVVALKELIDAGIHFGHSASRWNPKMKPYIFGRRNSIHIIDVKATVKGLVQAYHLVEKLASQGKAVLFVGTKPQAGSVVERESSRCEMHYVSQRWLGGTLTNYETGLSRLGRLEELERRETSGLLDAMRKKAVAQHVREKRRLLKNLSGIRKMTKLPGLLVVVDPKKEKNAVAEARRMGIPTIALLDTDCDPESVDIAIPGNDDAMRAIEVVIRKLADAALAGRRKMTDQQGIEQKLAAETAPAEADAIAAKKLMEVQQGR